VVDTYCFSREGAQCEGFLARGCRHCGRIITLELMEQQRGTMLLIGQMLQKAGLNFISCKGRHTSGGVHIDEIVVPTLEDKKLVDDWAAKEGFPVVSRVGNEEELKMYKEREAMGVEW
jgi:hypothetical protein